MTNLNHDEKIYYYTWTEGKNTLPFNYKCKLCGTRTLINERDPAKLYECSNVNCNYRLKFI